MTRENSVPHNDCYVLYGVLHLLEFLEEFFLLLQLKHNYELIGLTFDLCPGTEDDPAVTEVLFDRVYTNFVEEVDAVDNGISDRDGAPR